MEEQTLETDRRGRVLG